MTARPPPRTPPRLPARPPPRLPARPPAPTIPEAPAPREPAWRGWIAWAAFYAAIALSLYRPWHDTGVPAAAAVPERMFSAERAFVHVDALATKLGRRPAGTSACARAADYIEAELRKLGAETARQVGSGTSHLGATTYVYRGVTNILARIPGRSAKAVLVSAHYDSTAGGPGAGDNALAVAAALEIVRALRGAGPLENTLVFNFNGAEELGLLGAAAFVNHPWFHDVVRFINLDASGGQGRQLLFQVSPGSADLVEAYASYAPHVHGTVLAQEIFGLLPFDTDYHVYRDAGLTGLDLAPYGDNYAYHSALDRADRMSRRTLQESGENVLAILRGLPAQDRPAADGAVAPYYDLLGLVMVRYSTRTATVLGLLVAALALVLACWPSRRVQRPLALLALGTASIALSTLLAVLVPIAFGLAVTLAGQTMSWYARPWIAPIVYGTFSLAGVLAAQHLLRWFGRRRGYDEADLVAALRRGLAVCWAALLGLTTALGLGASYLPLWWCAGAAIALVASALLRGALRGAATLAGFAMAALTTAQAAQQLLTALVPLTGILGPAAPAELLIAAVTAAALAPFAVALAPLLQASPPRIVAAGLGLAAAASIALIVFSFPYTEERPKRMHLKVHAGGPAAPRVVVHAIDPGPRPAVAPQLIERQLAAPLPAIEVAPGRAPAPGSSAIDVRVIAAGAYRVDIRLEGDTTGWSLGPGAAPARHLIWTGTTEPPRFRIDKVAGTPVKMSVKAYHLGSEIPLDRTLEQLPRWALSDVQTVLEANATL